jgi:hypothetical protein
LRAMLEWEQTAIRKRGDGDGAPSRNGTGGGRANNSKKARKEVSTKLGMDTMEELVALTAKLSLQTAATVRRVAGEVEICLLMPIDQPSAIEAMATGTLFNDARGSKNPRWEGSPHHHVWASIVSTLIKDDRTPTVAKEVLRRHAATVKKPSELDGIVNTCMARKTKEPRTIRIVLQASGIDDVLRAMVSGLKAQGATEKFGAAPRRKCCSELVRLNREHA